MINAEFKPSYFHPYFFIRRGLFRKVSEYSHELNGKLLDFGCGSKPYQSLLGHVKEYVGIDFENEGHSHANEQIDVFYDGKHIPFEAGYFDSILSSEVFEHIFNIEEVLTELNRVLKPGGTILITCPFVWKEHEVPYDFARYTHFALQHLFEKNGFRIKTLDKSGHFIEVLFQLKVLYFYDNWHRKVANIPVVNFISKCVFMALPNFVGAICSKVLPKNRQMYLNNVIVAEKC